MGNIIWPRLAALIMLSNITGEDQLHQEVTVLIGGTINMLIRQNFSQPVKEVLWKFTGDSQTHKIAEIKDNKPEMYALFLNRLEILRDGMDLRIKNGTLKDSGNYSACITLENHEMICVSFSVNLHEPLSDPTTRTHYENEKGLHHSRDHWPVIFSLPLVVLLLLCAACKISCKKEEHKLSVEYEKCFANEDVKLGIPESNRTISLQENNSKEEEPFQIPEYAEKYSQHGFISVRVGKLEENCSA